ncbi:hypothetical protein TRVL_01033 [Trypanosoma vivax]|nr:hypothetical protein TRVL_01033 [Trypanosoma vivax]
MWKKKGCGMTADGNPTSFVFVNGTKITLRDDGRLALYSHFPEGSVLFDSSDVPPREVPLSAATGERGVTLHRLLPHSHYEAYAPDAATGDLFPLVCECICAYVSGLPPNTTAEMLGRFFESFDMVEEADVFTTATGECNGCGWVILQDPTKLFLVPSVMEFFPRNFIYVALSDVVPQGSICRLPMAVQQRDCGKSRVVSRVRPTGGARCVAERKQVNHVAPAGRSIPIVSGVTASVAKGSGGSGTHYFVVALGKEEAEHAVADSAIFTSIPNQRAFYKTMERGPVVLIFVLPEYAAVFGYGRLLPRSVDNEHGTACPVEWIRHHVFIQQVNLAGARSVPIGKMNDGVPLKHEIGENICQLADAYPNIEHAPTPMLTPAPRSHYKNSATRRRAAVNGTSRPETMPAPVLPSEAPRQSTWCSVAGAKRTLGEKHRRF